MTRQPKSCYATADLLTHISRKGAGETGAKCPASHSTQGSPSQKTGTASTRPTDFTTTEPSTVRNQEEKTFRLFFVSVCVSGGFSSKGTRKGGNGSETAFVSGKPESFFPLLLHQDMERYVMTECCFSPFVLVFLSLYLSFIRRGLT